jgi:hypothetical protein
MYLNEKGDTTIVSKVDIRVLAFWLRHPLVGRAVMLMKVLLDAARQSS